MDFKHIKLPSIDSTNSFAKKLEKEIVQPDFCCVSTTMQSEGRGQAQNSWQSEAGKNLTFSLIIHPKTVNASEQFYISKLISVAIVDFLNNYEDNFAIKWPNDIYFKNSKIGGILIENSLSGSRISSCVIGVGLNINQVQFSDTLPNPTSLKLITQMNHDLEQILNELVLKVYRKWSLITKREFDDINDSYFSSLYQYNTLASYKDKSGEFLGTIIGAEESGHLLIKTSGGEIRSYSLKEVSFL